MAECLAGCAPTPEVVCLRRIRHVPLDGRVLGLLNPGLAALPGVVSDHHMNTAKNSFGGTWSLVHCSAPIEVGL